MQTHIQSDIHTYIYIHTGMQTGSASCATDRQTYIHSGRHTYIQIYRHTYIHTDTDTYIRTG